MAAIRWPWRRQAVLDAVANDEFMAHVRDMVPS
jgi:hypothetical protein